MVWKKQFFGNTDFKKEKENKRRQPYNVYPFYIKLLTYSTQKYAALNMAHINHSQIKKKYLCINF